MNERHRARQQKEMTHGVREDENNREDAAKRAKEAQCSFERFSGTIPWRSVSDSEGMAAFGMLGLQQAGDGGSRSTSRDNATSGYPRSDSDTWSLLLASGGEAVPGANGGGRGASLVAGGETPPDSRTRGSPFASVSGEDMLTGNDPGPMPELPPFGGYGSHGVSSGSGSGRSRSSDSRTGPLRTSRDSNSLEVLSSLSFGNYPSNSSWAWGLLERNRSSSSGTGSVGDGDGGEVATSFFGISDILASKGRQYSFDPYRPIDPRGSMSKVPMIFDHPREPDSRSKPPVVTAYQTLRGTSWERHSPTYGESTNSSAATPEAVTVDGRHLKEDQSRDWRKEDRFAPTKDPGAMSPHRCPALGSNRPPHPVGERKTEEPKWSPPAHHPHPIIGSSNDRVVVVPVHLHQGGCKEEHTTVPSQAAAAVATSEKPEKPSEFDLLASMIPDLSKLHNNSKGGASISSTTITTANSSSSGSGSGTLQAPPRFSSAVVGSTPGQMGQAPLGSKVEVLPPVTRSPSPPRTSLPTSLPEGLENEIRDYHGFLQDRPVLLTGRQVRICRVM